MSREWPYLSEAYLDLLNLGDLIGFSPSIKDAQADILRSTMSIFRAESAQFCLHNSDKCIADKNNTALVNLSWKYTEQYIRYYHDLDPFINTIPQVSAWRDVDLMPRSDWERHEFNCDFIRPQKIRHLLVIHLRNSDEIIGHIGLHRYDRLAFSRKDLFKARFLSTLFSRNLIQRQMMQKLACLEKLIKEIMLIPSMGVVVLDPDLHPVYWNTKTIERDFPFINSLAKNKCKEKNRLTLPEELINECVKIQKTLRNRSRLLYDSRKKMIWISPEQGMEVEIITLPIEQTFHDENSIPFYFVLVLNRIDQVDSNLGNAFDSIEVLTPKESEIAQHICQGLTNREISEKLFISLPTVATHVQHIFQKLDIKNRSKLVPKMMKI